MTTRVTDFRIDRYEIPMNRFYKLPEQTRELLRVYGREVLPPPKDGIVTIEIAAYRLDEILESMRVLPAAKEAPDAE
jgi:hypothetical protein